MIRFFPSAIAALSITFGISQVDFQNISLEEAIKRAKEEDKLVFVDVYAEWCGPCKMLDKNVFPDKELGEKLNASFVSIKIDGDDEMNWGLKESFEVTAYPTLLMINPKSGKNRKIEGYVHTETLIAEAGYAIHPETSPARVAKSTYEASPTRENMKEWIEEVSNDNGSSVEELYSAVDLFIENYPDLDFEDEVEVVIFIISIKGLEDPNLERFIAEIESQDPEVVQYVFMQLIRASFMQAKEADDLSIVHTVIQEAHPLFKGYIDEELTEETMLKSIEEAFNE